MEPSRANYCHPYEPYDIQLGFMKCLYQAIEDSKVAIFESPTGTGKSLSLICGALTWLRDDARRRIEAAAGKQNGSDLDDWLLVAEKAAQRKAFLQELMETEQKLNAIRKKEITRQQAVANTRQTKKIKLDANHLQPAGVDDESFILDDYASDNERGGQSLENQTLSSSTLALLDKLKPKEVEEIEPEMDQVKVIFCSRTHSQITQFVNELRKVNLPPALPQDFLDSEQGDTEQIIKHLPLGSRKNLCINDKVSRLTSTLAINERCLDLQKPGTAKDHKCQYLPSRDDRVRVEAFRDRAIATIRDIEDLGKLGQKMQLCPYYASRSAIPLSEVLTLPYPLLLQKSAREALGVSIKDNIVIIDEAHNLMDAIANTLSISVSLVQLETATKQIVAYVQRFKNKLKGANRMYVTQLIRLLNSFTDYLRNAANSNKQNECAVTAAELMAGKGVDQIKPHKLLHYLAESKLAYKVEGYAAAQAASVPSNPPKGILMQFQNFLSVLMNPDSEGRFFVSKQDDGPLVRYTLLDPREHFRDIVEQARAVILAGGTMSPMSDYKDYLFSYINTPRLSTFSFGHVIPSENMLVEAVVSGPTGIEFDFTFGRRNSEIMKQELGQLFVRTCRTVPDGVVAFFPSYDYLAEVTSSWRRVIGGESIISALASIKRIFEESRGSATENLLQEYSQAIDDGGGAIMLSVVGGKLSEGINFSDKLGRAIIAVGLPFPNMHSAEWKAKIEYVELMTYRKHKDAECSTEEQASAQAKAAGRDFYENACMRAVNQSIGRAIRHSDDYAAILLVDRRFATKRIQSKLPQWIQGSMRDDVVAQPWISKEKSLQKFFSNKSL